MHKKPSEILQDIENEFRVPTRELKKLISDFHSEMRKGLSGERSSLKMIPEYLARPTGREKGIFLGLDLGGTSFRVSLLKLDGKRIAKTLSVKTFVLKKTHITGTGERLFDFLADRVKEFAKENSIDISGRRRIGFTFSFPVKKESASSGILLSWTKGFKARAVEGKDVVSLFNDSLARKGFGNTKIVALANDTVSTLIAKSYENPNCDMGLILGTGTNACYAEKISNIKKLKYPKRDQKEMIINIEWGNFDKVCLTRYDKDVDRFSPNRGKQIFEKMISGMYLGEIARLLLKASFQGTISRTLQTPYKFKSEYLSIIEADESRGLSRIGRLLRALGVKHSSYGERLLIKRITRIVSSRGARLVGGAVASVVTKVDPELMKKHIVSIDGSLYERYPHFSKRIKNTLKELLGKKASNIKLVLTKDGSSKGAAVIAAMSRF